MPSSANDVTGRSSMPQATMCSRMYVMSVVTLRANPCIVRPWQAHADAAILRGRSGGVNPDARITASRRHQQAELGEGVVSSDRHDVAGAPAALGIEGSDGRPVAGAVVRDVAAAVDGDEVGADRGGSQRRWAARSACWP